MALHKFGNNKKKFMKSPDRKTDIWDIYLLKPETLRAMFHTPSVTGHRQSSAERRSVEMQKQKEPRSWNSLPRSRSYLRMLRD